MYSTALKTRPKHTSKTCTWNNMEEWALGLVFKTVHQSANKCISNISTIKFNENAGDTFN